MLWAHFAGMTAALITIVLATPTQAQQPAPPPFATTKVADNVYIFRYGGHQSMFIVTPDGEIATDPISERRFLEPRNFESLTGRSSAVLSGPKRATCWRTAQKNQLPLNLKSSASPGAGREKADDGIDGVIDQHPAGLWICLYSGKALR